MLVSHFLPGWITASGAPTDASVMSGATSTPESSRRPVSVRAGLSMLTTARWVETLPIQG